MASTTPTSETQQRPDPGHEQDDDEVVIPGYLAELWRGGEAARPGPKRAVDLRGIAAAAVELADSKGLAAVSMRSVAAALGFTSMALYRYLDSKDELLASMVDVAYGTPPEIDPQRRTGWRERMTVWAGAELEVMRRHPWVLQSPTYEPPITPNTLAWMESALAAMDDAPMTDQQKLGCLLTVTVYVHGQAQLVQDVRTRQAVPGRIAYQRRLAAVIDRRALPRVAALLSSGMLDDDTDVSEGDRDFEFGLSAILDGAAAAQSDAGEEPQ